MNNNVLCYLEKTEKEVPDKLAFSDGVEGLSFHELYCRARSVGTYFAGKIEKRRPIAVLMKKGAREIAAFFGVLYAGSFYAALDADMPRARMELILQSLNPYAVLCDKENQKTAEELKFDGEVVLYEDIERTPIDEKALRAIRERHIDTDPMYVVFTSGSTGIPKGVAACHRSVIDYTESLCEAIGFDRNTVFANQTPLYFDAPLKEIMPTIKFGATTYFVPKKYFMFPMQLCDYLNEYKINTVCWVVSALTMISAFGVLEKNKPRYLSTICFGSEVFPRLQYDLWREAYPDARMFNLYGPTEATGMSCYWKADRKLNESEPIPVGRPFTNTDILLLDEKGRAVREGEVGEICMRGTCVTLGYYNNPEKTSEVFVQNPLNTAYPELIYKTGDLGRINEFGELVFLTRRDSQIKHMGHRIELGEIEAVAADRKEVKRACCVYQTEKKKILLYYVGDVEEAELAAQLRDLLPRYMLPSQCVKLEQMPLTPNGKIDRKLLHEKAQQL